MIVNTVIQRDVSLQPYNAMAVPAMASHLLAVETLEQLDFALTYAKQHALRPLVLGEGSNTLFTQHYQGLIILNRLKGIELVEETNSSVLVKVNAGENWHEWVLYCLENGWHGLENLALIPGMVGAAPMQNIGAYGVELKDCLSSVELVMIEDGARFSLSNQECEFSYRDSLFKREMAGRAIVTAVTFRLNTHFVANLGYPALQNLFKGSSTVNAKKVVETVCLIRKSKLPLPADLPNLGSFFKNPIVSLAEFEKLHQKHPDLVWFQQEGAIKLAAGWLIEQAGWKDMKSSSLRVHADQALVIVNPEKVSGRDVLSFAAEIQTDISNKYGVTLEIEPRIY